MDRLPKDAALGRVAACCGAFELGSLCCVGSEQAAVGQGVGLQLLGPWRAVVDHALACRRLHLVGKQGVLCRKSWKLLMLSIPCDSAV